MSRSPGKFEDPTNTDDRIDEYEIIKPIGKGKFAIVYRAKRKSDEMVVALKKISIEAMDEKQRKKTLKEVRLLQSLDHPNIVQYLDSFIHGDELVIVVEWAAAGDLKRQLRKAQERGAHFEERVIWKYFAQICEAISHMHERRIMHRDLKPANIFLTLNGEVKVGDLGLGRELSEDTLEARSKVGTPLYMSPEVLRGDGYDFKSDVWSVGCLLYELAKLKSPFKKEGLNLYLLFQNISKGDYPPLPDHYSDDLKNMAYGMISTNPADRPDIHSVCRVAREMKAKFAQQKAAKAQQQIIAPEPSTQKENGAPEGIQQAEEGPSTPRMRINTEDNQPFNEVTPNKHRINADPGQLYSDQQRPSRKRSDDNLQNGFERAEQNDVDKPKNRRLASRSDSNETAEKRKNRDTPHEANAIPRKDRPPVAAPPNKRGVAPEGGIQAAMESIWDNLSVLNYPGLHWEGNKPPLNRTQFSMENGGGLIHARQQFEDMVHVAVWLLSEMGVEHGMTPAVIQATPPNSIATELLSVCQMAGLPPDLSNILKPTSLRTGYGEAVCQLLGWLSLATVNHKRKIGEVKSTLEYREDIGLEDQGEDDDENEVIEESVDEDEGSDEDTTPFNFREDAGEHSGAGTFFSRSMIAATVDPSVWREELERVGSLLRKSSSIGSSKSADYMNHLQTFHKHMESFVKLGVKPEEKGAKVQRSMANRMMMRSTFANEPVVETDYDAVRIIRDLGLEVGRIRESVARGEARVNNIMSLHTLSRDYGALKLNMKEVEEQQRQISEQVRAKMEELQDLSDVVKDISQQLKEKGSGMSDTSGLINIKGAIKTIKAEIKQMDITIGVRQLAVWDFHQKAAASKGKKPRKKESSFEESHYSIEDSLSPLVNSTDFRGSDDEW